MIDERLRTHPKVREEAERRARELWAIQAPLFAAARFDTVMDPEEVPEGFAITVEAQTRLLADVERPETRDWLVRSGRNARTESEWVPMANRWETLRNNPRDLVEEWLKVMK